MNDISAVLISHQSHDPFSWEIRFHYIIMSRDHSAVNWNKHSFKTKVWFNIQLNIQSINSMSQKIMSVTGFHAVLY